MSHYLFGFCHFLLSLLQQMLFPLDLLLLLLQELSSLKPKGSEGLGGSNGGTFFHTACARDVGIIKQTHGDHSIISIWDIKSVALIRINGPDFLAQTDLHCCLQVIFKADGPLPFIPGISDHHFNICHWAGHGLLQRLHILWTPGFGFWFWMPLPI